MSKTKLRILEAALRLFNREGYGNVTVRTIALELNMSSGNLTYHFRKREEILEALYFEMVEVFDRRIAEMGQKKISLLSIREDMYHSLERMIAYRFFWTDLYNILRLNEAIRAHFDQAHGMRVHGYKQLFAYLRNQGLMKDFEFGQEEALLIDRMIGFSNTWLYNSQIEGKKVGEKYTQQQTTRLLSMLYSHFTESGKEEFRKVMPALFE